MKAATTQAGPRILELEAHVERLRRAVRVLINTHEAGRFGDLARAIEKAREALVDTAPASAKKAPTVEQRRVSHEEWEKELARRQDELDAMPGGAQGASPDMSDLIEEGDDDDQT